MKLSSNIGIIIALGILGLIALIVVVAIYTLSSDNLVKTPNTPQELWQRRITADVEEDTARIVNSHDGYAITIPASWQVPETASGTSGLSIFYHPLGFATKGTDPPEGLFLKITVVSTPPNTDVSLWAQQNLGAGVVTPASLGSNSGYVFSRPLQEANEQLEVVSIENSLQKTFLIPRSERIFIVSCSAEGDAYLSWITLCEEYTPSFEIL